MTVYAPLQLIEDAVTEKAGIQLYIKREDLIHPQISGNKWRKLKYNLAEAHKTGKNTLLTFGGAFSNHIYALAAAGKLSGFQTIGIIRGEEHLPLNSTLSFAVSAGMRLHYVNRTDYREKDKTEFIDKLHQEFGDFYLIPEGGSNALAVKGCREITEEINIPYDYLCCSCGTGGTLAGLIAGVKIDKKMIGFSALKGGEFLKNDINNLLSAYYKIEGIHSAATDSIQWHINADYHFGGYAKTTSQLYAFIDAFRQIHQILLEPIYTGKMLFGVYDLVKRGYFRRGETIIAIHTGGLQGSNL